MADITALNIERAPEWRLLAEFVVTEDFLGKSSQGSPIKEAIRDLNLQPEQLERICEVITNALSWANRNEEQADNRLAVRIRIWSSSSDAYGASWGFFLVEKPGREANRPSSEAEYNVDLFLYREYSS